MPVRKYRSVAEMPPAAFRPRHDPANLRIACDLSSTAIRLAQRRILPGVHRFESVVAASEQRERWERSPAGRP